MASQLPKIPAPRPLHTGSSSNPFSRALQEIGGTTIQQARTLPGDMTNETFRTVFGTNTPSPASVYDNNQSGMSDFAQRLEQSSHVNTPEFDTQQRQTMMHSQEVQLTEIYNTRKAKDKQTVEQLQQELKGLVVQVKLDPSVQTTAHADVVKPGKGHIIFFQQIISYVSNILSRKRTDEASQWNAGFSTRKGKGAFWSQVDNIHGGTAYMMSQEHQIARSVG